MKDSSTLAGNATIKQFQNPILLLTKGQHEGVKYPYSQCNYQATSKFSLLGHQRQSMKESNSLAHSATIKQLQCQILLDTKEQYTKELNTLEGNSTIKQLQSIVLLHTKGQYMKESNSIVSYAPTKQLQSPLLLHTKRQNMKESNSLAHSATIK